MQKIKCCKITTYIMQTHFYNINVNIISYNLILCLSNLNFFKLLYIYDYKINNKKLGLNQNCLLQTQFQRLPVSGAYFKSRGDSKCFSDPWRRSHSFRHVVFPKNQNFPTSQKWGKRPECNSPGKKAATEKNNCGRKEFANICCNDAKK